MVIMLKRSVVVVALMGSLLSSLGCSKYLKLNLINNSGHSVLLVRHQLTLIQGESHVINYPTVSIQRVLSLSSSECDYEYSFPETLEGYFGHKNFEGVVVAQIEKDFHIYLVEPKNRSQVTSSQRRFANQESGFPLKYINKRC